MKFLKGIVTIAGAPIAFVVATIVFVVLKTNALPRPEGFTGQVGVDIKVVLLWLLYSPLYWAVVLTRPFSFFRAGFFTSPVRQRTVAGAAYRRTRVRHFTKLSGTEGTVA